MGRRTLRSGYTTGACAAAAAQGATLLLLGVEPPPDVSLRLPWNDPAAREVRFSPVGWESGPGWASCGVVKDAGDDPDVTDGVEIRASVAWEERSPDPQAIPSVDDKGNSAGVRIEGGEGVGRVTKPGLAVAVGRAAINPVPLAMIEAGVREALKRAAPRPRASLSVRISVPRGEEVARRTLNARLGILGGISILGTTGIVIPMSADAWRATIDSSLDVARAAGARAVVLSHGRSSEAAAHALFPSLPPEAFVLMGDHVGYGLEAAASRGLPIVLAGQFAKFCKVAAGHFETHVRDSRLEMAFLARLLRQAGLSEARAQGALSANTAREVYENLRGEGCAEAFDVLVRLVAFQSSDQVQGRVPVETVLFGYAKECLTRFSVPARASAEGRRG